MKLSAALEANPSAVREAMRRFGIRDSRVSSPVLHGQDTDGGDLDTLVDLHPDEMLLDLGGLQFGLGETPGIPLALLTPVDIPMNYHIWYCRKRFQ